MNTNYVKEKKTIFTPAVALSWIILGRKHDMNLGLPWSVTVTFNLNVLPVAEPVTHLGNNWKSVLSEVNFMAVRELFDDTGLGIMQEFLRINKINRGEGVLFHSAAAFLTS